MDFLPILNLIVFTCTEGHVKGTSLTEPLYFCRPENMCYRREIRCTSREICRYEGRDMCFKSASDPKAYSVLVGHVRIIPVLEWPSRFGWEHHFLQYRGFAYIFGVHGVQVWDLNANSYPYRSTGRFTRSGLVNVGHSYCTFSEVREFVSMWHLLRYRLITRNNKHFVTALKTFVTTGFCSEQRRHDSGDFLEEAKTSSFMIISNYMGPRTTVHHRRGRELQWSMTEDLMTKTPCDVRLN